MNLLSKLNKGDYVVQRLVAKYLLDQPIKYSNKGWIKRNLDLFDNKTKMWGNSIYDEWWICSFYTLRDLYTFEIEPTDKIFNKGLETLVYNIWNKDTFIENDICVIAMMLSMVVYVNPKHPAIKQQLDYILDNHQQEGGWNCFEMFSHSKHSSIHTTLSVLETLRDVKKTGISYRLKEINAQEKAGQLYLLERKLLYKLKNQELITKRIDEIHFPYYWYYDFLRALFYFASVDYKYDNRLKPSLDLLKSKFKKGYLGKGRKYKGKIHFQLEQDAMGYMNTFRGLYVLKKYDNKIFRELTEKEINI
jgi:hypothetical protein